MKKYYYISNKEKENLLEEFCEAISVLNNTEEIMNFITDLLSEQETIMIAKRIKIAKMIIQNKNYREIQNSLKVGANTISRINEWLAESGEGFKMVAERSKKENTKNKSSEPTEFQKLKKRYPSLFWPEFLIKDLIKIMDSKQKEKIRRNIEKLGRKSQLYKQLDSILRNN